MGFADEFVADLKTWGSPEEPDREQLRDLVVKYVLSPLSGPGYPRDPVKDEILRQLAFAVFKLVLPYRNRNNAADVLGEAMLALVECVERWPGVGDDWDISAYVAFNVRRRIKDFMDNDSVFKVPSRRVREKDARGQKPEPIKTLTLDENDSPAAPADTMFSFQDLVWSLTDERDRKIVEMKIMGLPVREIAAEVGQRKSWIYKRLKAIEQTFAREGDLCTPPR